MTTFYSFRFETLKAWRARSPYLYSIGTEHPGYNPGAEFHFLRLLWLAGLLRLRYSIPPPHEYWLAESESSVTTDGQSASLSWNKVPICGLRPDFYYYQTLADLLMLGSLSLTRGQVCRLQLLLVLAGAVILMSESVGLATIFYCLRFETSLFVASYDSQSYSGDIQPPPPQPHGTLQI
jgi:hypothetical protein